MNMNIERILTNFYHVTFALFELYHDERHTKNERKYYKRLYKKAQGSEGELRQFFRDYDEDAPLEPLPDSVLTTDNTPVNLLTVRRLLVMNDDFKLDNDLIRALTGTDKPPDFETALRLVLVGYVLARRTPLWREKITHEKINKIYHY